MRVEAEIRAAPVKFGLDPQVLRPSWYTSNRLTWFDLIVYIYIELREILARYVV
jgi:hypothetical protein